MIEILPNLHPIFVHFTIALFVVATAFLLIGTLGNQRSWADNLIRAGYWNLWAGAVLTVATFASGYFAYFTVTQDEILHVLIEDHRNWALIASLLFWGAAFWSIRKKLQNVPLFLAAAMITATLALAVTSYKGGELVYRYGVGVLESAR